MNPNNRMIAGWLLVCCLLVFSMILLGGVTRLTQSGLSMVEWEPIMGVIPPLSETEWLEAFNKYQAYPEYQSINKDMGLKGFKRIFYVEYAHRILGRVLGLVFFIPLMVFLIRRKLDRGLVPKLFIMFVLGGMQGLLGWYMVQSGLIDDPRVSPYRLTAHLMLAVVILGYMLWVVFGLLRQDEVAVQIKVRPSIKYYSWIVLLAVSVMILTGGFVAGNKAGYAFNTFPKMYDQWVPDGLWVIQPLWRNFFENVITVQFIHRCMAFILSILVLGFWYATRRTDVPGLHFSSNILVALLAVQTALGITTLLYVVPIPLAVAHQGGALLVFSATLFVVYLLGYAGDAENVHKREQMAEPIR